MDKPTLELSISIFMYPSKMKGLAGLVSSKASVLGSVEGHLLTVSIWDFQVCVLVSFLVRTSVILDQEPPIGPHFIFLPLEDPVSKYSPILRQVRTSTYEFEGDTIQPTTLILRLKGASSASSLCLRTAKRLVLLLPRFSTTCLLSAYRVISISTSHPVGTRGKKLKIILFIYIIFPPHF